MNDNIVLFPSPKPPKTVMECGCGCQEYAVTSRLELECVECGKTSTFRQAMRVFKQPPRTE